MTGLQASPTRFDASGADRAVAFATGWTRWYTGRVGDDAGARRCAEIESDLWEQLADARQDRSAQAGVAASIAWRVVAGMPADLSWMRHHRAIARGRQNREKESMMNAFARVVGRWWWPVLALAIAVVYVVLAVGNLAQPGTPNLESTIHALVCAALIVAGVAVRAKWPLLAGLLVIAGAAPAALLWWAPVLAVVAVIVLIGAVIDVVVIPSAQGRVSASATVGRAFAVLGAIVATVAPVALGILPGLAVGLAVIAVLVVATVVRRREATPIT
jgi:hypothetical protein